MTQNTRGKISKQRYPNYVYYLAVSVALATFLVYLSSLHNAFVNWDDPEYVFENIYIRSFKVAFFQWAFFDFYAFNWHPLTWISHALDYAVWGLNPLGHHLSSNILHAVNTFLVVVLVSRLLEAWSKIKAKNGQSAFLDNRAILITGGMTGLLFGLHPIHVESAAWVSERKDLLCALFFLLSILTYTKYLSVIENESIQKNFKLHFLNKYYLFALGFFVLALLSKPMAVTLPFVLLLLDWYPFNRIQSISAFLSAFIGKLPFILLSLGSSVITVLAQKEGGAINMKLMESVPLASRVLVAAKSLIVYLGKMILPVNLIPYYPYPKGSSLFSLEYLSSVVLVVGITACCVAMVKKQKLWLSVWAYYVVTLIPVIGLVQVGGQSMADRYTYLPSLGPFLMIGLAMAWSWSRVNAFMRMRAIVKVVAISVFMLLSTAMVYLTFEQLGIWRDSMTLWSYVIGKEPESVPHAYISRGTVFDSMGRFDKAIEDYDKAIALNPANPDAYNNRGAAFGKMGRFDKAIEDYDKAIELNPKYVAPYYNMACLYSVKNNISEACQWFKKSIDMGLDNWNHIKQDSDLENIRTTTCYKEIMGGK